MMCVDIVDIFGLVVTKDIRLSTAPEIRCAAGVFPEGSFSVFRIDFETHLEEVYLL